jgi:hypothetical protein
VTDSDQADKEHEIAAQNYAPERGKPEPSTPAWRSPALLRALTIGIVGLVASCVIAGSLTQILVPCEGAECSWKGLIQLFYLPLFLAPGTLITGFLVARSSPGAAGGLGALAVAVLVVWLAASIIFAVAPSIDLGSMFVALGFFPLFGALPVLVGFGVGRLVPRLRARRRPHEAG